MNNQTNTEKKQKNRERSIAYPSINLEKAIELVSKLRSELGKGPYSREDAAKGIGYAGISGASARSVAALVHYGLLERNGDTYQISELGEEIIHPTDETDAKRKMALVTAAKSPKLFQKIVNRFQGQSLPGLLDNILVREGVSSNYSKEVATILKESLIFSGILQNGVIIDASSVTFHDDETEQASTEQSKSSFADFGFFSSTNKEQKKNLYTFSDSGSGWSVIIKSDQPVTSEIKTLLIKVSELLENNKQK
jgi:hypothetical protein